MPIYYNQQSPTPTTKNTITSVAIGTFSGPFGGIRDFLLNKNLLPTSVFPSTYSTNTAINGSPKVGEPVLDTLVNAGANVIPNNYPISTWGVTYKNLNVLPNTFKNIDSNADSLKTIDYVQDIEFTLNGLSVFGNSEWPQGIQSYPRKAEDELIRKYGLLIKSNNGNFRKDNVIKNLYLDATKQIDVSDLINSEIKSINNQVSGYLDTYGNLNLGNDNKFGNGVGIEAANAVGSILNGQGVGLTQNGVVSNFDIRSSLAGRVLGATGLLKDTKLGQIGGQQLALALANNAAFNLQQDIIGKFNVRENVLSVIKGDGLTGLRPDYTISIPDNDIGEALDYTAKVLGFTLPRSYMNDAGSIFQSETGEIQNIERANNLLLTTGKGQLKALLRNVKANQIGTSDKGYDNPDNTFFRTGYFPSYIKDNDGDERIENAIIYAFSEKGEVINLFATNDGSGKGFKTIPNLNSNREELVENEFPDTIKEGRDSYEQKDGSNVNKVMFSWGSREGGIPNSDFYGDYFPFIGERKSLLTKTQLLFNSNGMKTIVTRDGIMSQRSTQIQTTNGGGMSKGSAVLSASMYDENGRTTITEKEPEFVYCRSWTTRERYDYVFRMVRSGTYEGTGLYGPDEGRVPFRLSNQNTVLEDTGFVKIAPYTNEFLNPDVKRAAKNYMLSIENLAWADSNAVLPKGELGLGDPLTGKRGRIMWFPPYDIQISESVGVEWEPHKFIGRGENIYTYNNTERSGQLSFKIIVDHPTYANTFRGANGPDDNYVASFFAGCIEPDSIFTDRFTVQQSSQIVPSTKSIPQPKKTPPEPPKVPDFRVYFPNDIAKLDANVLGYEGGKSGSTNIDYSNYTSGAGTGLQPGEFTKNTQGTYSSWPDDYNYGLNFSVNSPITPVISIDGTDIRGFMDPNYYPTLTKFLKEKCEFCYVETIGFASPQGKDTPNKNLAVARAKYLRTLLVNNVASQLGLTKEQIDKKFIAKTSDSKEVASTTVTIGYDIENGTVTKNCYENNGAGCKNKVKATKSANGCITCPRSMSQKLRAQVCRPDTKGCKLDRFAVVSIKYDAKAALDAVAPPAPCIETTEQRVTTTLKEKFYNETLFFDKLLKNDRFIFDKFREKIRYFHPAFHSTTPEGLNSRLTFLHQCTRQGPTLESVDANNLAFGRAPICILRVGDFFYTKIAIDSLSIDYEPLVWDLNPEGIGVQPMIANVSLSFKFIGAESLYGPINKLQNALSFNYYANSGIYEARADYISAEKGPTLKDIDPLTGKEISIESKQSDVTKNYFNNGRYTINPTLTTKTEELSKKNSCDVDQTKANETTISNENNQNASSGTTGTTSATTSATTSGYTAFEIQKNISIVSVNYEKEGTINPDYTIKLVLKFNPTKDVKEFMIGTQEGVLGRLYLLSDAGKNKLYIGSVTILKNDANTMIVQASDSTGETELIIKKDPPVENFNLEYYIQDADDEAIFVTEMLTKPQPMFTVEWTRNGGKMNCAFPYK